MPLRDLTSRNGERILKGRDESSTNFYQNDSRIVLLSQSEKLVNFCCEEEKRIRKPRPVNSVSPGIYYLSERRHNRSLRGKVT
jgi:hypothetical protein